MKVVISPIPPMMHRFVKRLDGLTRSASRGETGRPSGRHPQPPDGGISVQLIALSGRRGGSGKLGRGAAGFAAFFAALRISESITAAARVLAIRDHTG